MSSKTLEAEDLISKAEKCLKTSLFKRTPDYDSAIEYYTKAAVIYRNCRSFPQAADLYAKIAELQMKVGSAFHCAKNYENAAFVYKDMKDFNKMAELVDKGGELLRKAGTPDSASYLYERAAKAIEQAIPEKAAEFYELSSDACEVEDKYHEAADQCNNAARIWVRLRRFAEAERLLRKYIEFSCKANPASTAATLCGTADSSAVPKLCSRAVVVMILMKLHQEDEVAANKIFTEAMQRWRFGESDDYNAVQRLLNAVEQTDGEAAAQALKASCFRTLDLDYVRLIKEIKFPTYETGADKDDDERKHHPPRVVAPSFSPTIPAATRDIPKSVEIVHEERGSLPQPTRSDEPEDEEDIC
ncbi:Gamma-soluble NSF attachment protein [Fasciola hepatica]|uniref:Gamma-soluble NSF attachment protein n=1 Tax=Fasciola hepatica TaxID=6192 RepID=A0A4E0RXQ2_FASHE|nr:Gamma-soluble NSF attachment protein [Fasciola hepatica]